MKARVWFEARGQSLRARGFNWHEAKVLIRLYSLPKWAQQAVARGHLNAAKNYVTQTQEPSNG